MPVPSILLLTETPPNYEGVGGIFLHDLCMHYPKESLCCFAICGSNCHKISQELNWLPTIYSRRSREAVFYATERVIYQLKLNSVQHLVKSFFRVSNFFLWSHAKIRSSDLIKEAVKFGNQHKVDIVWATLSGPTLIYIARKIASELNAKLVTTVWDPPEYILSNPLCFDRFSRHSLLKEFEKTMQNAVRCGVASEQMKIEYEKKYDVESVVMIHGIHPDLRKTPKKELNNQDQFVIGFAGSLYAIEEWQALISALSKINWQIDGRDVSIVLLGKHRDFLYRNVAQHVKYLGRRSVEETVDLMSKVDVTYLPYWFDESYQISARLCFPTKLATYVAAGRPVLFHGPEYSSVTDFFNRFHIGLCCHSLEEAKIIECLNRFVTDKDFYAKSMSECQLAMDQELNLYIFLKRFASLIGIDEKDLLL